MRRRRTTAKVAAPTPDLFSHAPHRYDPSTQATGIPVPPAVGSRYGDRFSGYDTPRTDEVRRREAQRYPDP